MLRIHLGRYIDFVSNEDCLDYGHCTFEIQMGSLQIPSCTLCTFDAEIFYLVSRLHVTISDEIKWRHILQWTLGEFCYL